MEYPNNGRHNLVECKDIFILVLPRYTVRCYIDTSLFTTRHKCTFAFRQPIFSITLIHFFHTYKDRFALIKPAQSKNIRQSHTTVNINQFNYEVPALLQFSAGFFFAWIDENPISRLESWMTLSHCHTYWKKGILTWNSHHSRCGMEILSHSISQRRVRRSVILKLNMCKEKKNPILLLQLLHSGIAFRHIK